VLISAGCGGARHAQSARSERVSPAAPPAPPAGCHYPARLRATLIHTCEAAARGAPGAAVRCTCTESYLEAHVPQRTLEATQRRVLEGSTKEPNWMLNAILACERA
jgi:hypothetical protein